jgi:hypothetical protein
LGDRKGRGGEGEAAGRESEEKKRRGVGGRRGIQCYAQRGGLYLRSSLVKVMPLRRL